jgi:serine/threonine protein kinase
LVEYRYVAKGANHTGAKAERMVGRCEMFDEIASGGMATIHLGRMVGAGGFTRTVAIKQLLPHFARDSEFVDMFLDEARLVARIRHPNVVATLDLVEEEGDLFIIMEYVEGLNFGLLLRAAREHGERPPPGISARVLTETLHGLHAAHEAHDEHGKPLGLVHRDVSPENILVGVDGYPRVLDFGVARAIGRVSSTRHGQVKGKLAYMAPEQVLGEPVDRRTDVFAASAVLWQALTGHRLLKANNAVELAHRLLNMKVEAPSKVTPDVPKKFDGIVMRGLEMAPDRRWKTAAAMAEALESVGGLSSNREVGLWVRRLGADRLSAIAAKVSALELKPVATEQPVDRKVQRRSRLAIPRSELEAAMKLAQAEMDQAEADAAEALRGPPSPQDTGEVPVVTGAAFLRGAESGEYPVDLPRSARTGATPPAAGGAEAAARTKPNRTEPGGPLPPASKPTAPTPAAASPGKQPPQASAPAGDTKAAVAMEAVPRPAPAGLGLKMAAAAGLLAVVAVVALVATGTLRLGGQPDAAAPAAGSSGAAGALATSAPAPTSRPRGSETATPVGGSATAAAPGASESAAAPSSAPTATAAATPGPGTFRPPGTTKSGGFGKGKTKGGGSLYGRD